MMFDIWGFLLQTLTASGVAVLLLVIKALFKDKLPPKWHFIVWSVLGFFLLIPAGWNGRYTLFNWQFIVELIKCCVGDFSFTRVIFPFPMIRSVPLTIAEWIFAAYTLGVIWHLAVYLLSYIRLKFVLSKGKSASEDVVNRVQRMSPRLKIKPCRVIKVNGLPSAFVCGVLRPVLVIPAGEQIDDKILLHELMHLKSKDTIWSVVICILRSIHWCNPLIVYCASCATNDMEKRCDQFVLEQLEGEERREYGHILLSMANEKFARTPGTTCVNNGGKHICDRVETIARFKKYPAGMGLVSICVLIILTLSLMVGVQATELYEPNHSARFISFASARSIQCTTPAGAFDAYGRAVLDQNGYYRVMCAPYSMQKELSRELIENSEKGIDLEWDFGIPTEDDGQSGYYVYNLKQCEENTYEGLMVFKLDCSPDGQTEADTMMYLAVQNVRVEKENGRWVAIPLETFQSMEAHNQNLEWGCMELPGTVYSGTISDIHIDLKVQTVYTVENTVQNPNAEFMKAFRNQSESLTYTGSAQDRDKIEQVGISSAPVYSGEKRPDGLSAATEYNSTGGSSTGERWSSIKTESGWGPTIELNGGGESFDPKCGSLLPEYYAVDLYINNELETQLDLHLQEE